MESTLDYTSYLLNDSKKLRYYNKARKTGMEQQWKDIRNIRRATKREIEQCHDKYVVGLLNFNKGANS